MKIDNKIVVTNIADDTVLFVSAKATFDRDGLNFFDDNNEVIAKMPFLGDDLTFLSYDEESDSYVETIITSKNCKLSFPQ